MSIEWERAQRSTLGLPDFGWGGEDGMAQGLCEMALTRRALLASAAAAGLVAALPSRAWAQVAAASSPEDQRLNAFFEDAFQTALNRSPEFQTFLGTPGATHDRWNDISEEFEAETQRLEAEGLAWMRREIDFSKLSEQGRLNYRLWEYRAERSLESYRWRHHQYALEHFNGRHSGMASLLSSVHPLRSPTDVKAWVARVNAIPGAVDQLIAQAEMQAAKGVLPPRFSLQKTLDATRGTLKGAPFEAGAKEDSALLGAVRKRLTAMTAPEPEKAALLAAATAALVESYAPAYRRLADAIEGLLAPATDDDGVWKLPDGDAFYRYCLKEHTTLDVAPDAIHELGLREVARIHRDMRTIMDRVGFKGDLQAFFQFLRTDPKFYYPATPEGHAAYIAEAERVLAEIREVLDGQFGVKPKAPVTVRRFDLYAEASEAIARYSPPATDGSRPGTYFVNFSNMREMPKYQLEVLAFHEAIPGHHMQIAIAQELQGLPRFRRFMFQTAYGEGWALYSERLPKELGFYKDPYSDFGRLTFELWRAIRLVVDTGIHAKRWTRQQAIDYFVANSSFPRESAAREIDRYIVWPAQACAYLMGMLKILELRERARTALGAGFDIRAFHDTILKNGSLPLSILEEVVETWIRTTKA